jgi:predicted RNA-binding Zn-ribbon protein involved in translation (DUF1610 family)
VWRPLYSLNRVGWQSQQAVLDLAVEIKVVEQDRTTTELYCPECGPPTIWVSRSANPAGARHCL